MNIGNELAALRRASGISQPALGTALGLSTPQIARIERGKRRADVELVNHWLSACDAVDCLDALLPLLPSVMVLDGSESAADSR